MGHVVGDWDVKETGGEEGKALSHDTEEGRDKGGEEEEETEGETLGK